MEVRKALLNDIPLLLPLALETFRDTYFHLNTPENFQLYLRENFTEAIFQQELNDPTADYWLAFIDNSLVGYAKTRSNAQYPLLLEVQRLYIAKAWHRQGLGTKLMDFCLTVAQQNQFEGIFLGVWEENHKAIAFYQSCGFEIFDKHIFVLGEDQQEDWLMKKTFA